MVISIFGGCFLDLLYCYQYLWLLFSGLVGWLSVSLVVVFWISCVVISIFGGCFLDLLSVSLVVVFWICCIAFSIFGGCFLD